MFVKYEVVKKWIPLVESIEYTILPTSCFRF